MSEHVPKWDTREVSISIMINISSAISGLQECALISTLLILNNLANLIAYQFPQSQNHLQKIGMLSVHVVSLSVMENVNLYENTQNRNKTKRMYRM